MESNRHNTQSSTNTQYQILRPSFHHVPNDLSYIFYLFYNLTLFAHCFMWLSCLPSEIISLASFAVLHTSQNLFRKLSLISIFFSTMTGRGGAKVTVLKTLHIHSTIFEHLLGTRILYAKEIQMVPDLLWSVRLNNFSM